MNDIPPEYHSVLPPTMSELPRNRLVPLAFVKNHYCFPKTATSPIPLHQFALPHYRCMAQTAWAKNDML